MLSRRSLSDGLLTSPAPALVRRCPPSPFSTQHAVGAKNPACLPSRTHTIGHPRFRHPCTRCEPSAPAGPSPSGTPPVSTRGAEGGTTNAIFRSPANRPHAASEHTSWRRRLVRLQPTLPMDWAALLSGGDIVGRGSPSLVTQMDRISTVGAPGFFGVCSPPPEWHPERHPQHLT
jgi:hypothetical protein